MTVNVVAIDGPVGSGKSTVARALAEALGWSYLDTGAMYRAVTAEALRRGVDLFDGEALGALAAGVRIETLPVVRVDGRDVTEELRRPETNDAVSVVAAEPSVRRALVLQQRSFASAHPDGVVVEGRDITTVVFPDARVKVYLTASLDERTRRRGDEDPDSVVRRDRIDTSRHDSPLAVAPGAVVIDTTERSVAEVVKEIESCLTASR